ncbi:ABC transporter permease [Pseudoflavitalea sp. X16]|uniref:ABC transporter permease n=1 Tax=Paraflavitalea devenefica TaxID=2716334 RepID=UPI001423A4FA|nr:ABC transporter permease [Paraflavitalea devenefica]NII28748.1 ABC transporter permease [Paraflavitalea devenefica]
MFSNYFKTAWRSLLHNKAYSILNILGLATGMAVALLIGLWVYDQSSYDRFLPGYEQAYQVRFNYNNNGEIHTQDGVCLPLAEALKNDIPEVAWATPAFGPVDNVLGLGDKRLRPKGMIGGDDFLKIFQFSVLKGNAATALKDPYSIVLTESTAKALFGDADPLNKMIRIDNFEDRKVTAVIKDVPRNSTFQFDYITAFSAFTSGGWVKAAATNWGHNFFKLYIGLQPNASYEQAASKSKTRAE